MNQKLGPEGSVEKIVKDVRLPKESRDDLKDKILKILEELGAPGQIGSDGVQLKCSENGRLIKWGWTIYDVATDTVVLNTVNFGRFSMR